jgi:hypothetical protein
MLAAIATIAIGFYIIDSGNPVLGHKVIGFTTAFIFLVLMPVFIVVRYRKKDLSKFNFHSKTKQEEDEEDDDWDDKSRWN